MNIVLIIVAALFLIFAVTIFLTRMKMKNIPLVTNHEKIVTLTEKNFQHQVKNKTILVDFWAAWCAPCRMMAPVLNELAGEMNGNGHIGKVNIEQYQALAKKYKIRSIPTMILFKNGVEKERIIGIKNKEFLLKAIKNVN